MVPRAASGEFLKSIELVGTEAVGACLRLQSSKVASYKGCL